MTIVNYYAVVILVRQGPLGMPAFLEQVLWGCHRSGSGLEGFEKFRYIRDFRGEASVRFGSVTVRGWKGSSGSPP